MLIGICFVGHILPVVERDGLGVGAVERSRAEQVAAFERRECRSTSLREQREQAQEREAEPVE
ncbi:MAG: hypothetical protein ACFHWZ_19050 [Phycisphaerales bacterium]